MIVIKEVKWSQSAEEIIIEVPMKNPASAADILTHENFIKIHAAPFYFEAFLLNRIIEEESRCQITSSEVRLILKKAEPHIWESLEREFRNKAEKAQVKSEILVKVQEKTEEKCKAKREQKANVKHIEVENSMARDAQRREAIENLRKIAIDKGLAAIKSPPKLQKVPDVVQSNSGKTHSKLGHSSDKPKPDIPSIRKAATIEVQFSQRNFVTPKRESQDPAEQEWLLKQIAAQKAIGFVPEDLKPEERDPVYLKQKGDDFFSQKNFLASISAYTTGIKIAPKCYELYLNRSAAHLAQQNYQRCVEDCSTAFELLHPPVALNLKARVQALARRGAALAKLGFIRQAYGELVAAVKLDPTNEMLIHDAEMLRAKIEATVEE